MSKESSIPNVKRWRKMIGMTNKAMADVLAYNPEYYRQMEKGDIPAADGMELRAQENIRAHLKSLWKSIGNECIT